MDDSDIVERLRNYNTCSDTDVDEAADEIERLRKERDKSRMEQIKQLEQALADRNTELLRVRDQRDRYKNALMMILDNMNSEPYAGEFARDVLRGMTADEYARQIRLDHAEVSRKLYEGEG